MNPSWARAFASAAVCAAGTVMSVKAGGGGLLVIAFGLYFIWRDSGA